MVRAVVPLLLVMEDTPETSRVMDGLVDKLAALESVANSR